MKISSQWNFHLIKPIQSIQCLLADMSKTLQNCMCMIYTITFWRKIMVKRLILFAWIPVISYYISKILMCTKRTKTVVWRNTEYIDLSNFPTNHPPYTDENKREVASFSSLRSETSHIPIIDVLCLASKFYSVLLEDGTLRNTTKGGYSISKIKFLTWYIQRCAWWNS